MKKIFVLLNSVFITCFLPIYESTSQSISYLSSPPNANRTLDLTKAVGSLQGNFSVNSAGAATYTIPIEIPPGTAGMQPDISLEFNSMAGNGIMGIGWNIRGISSITRVGQDRFNEGDIRSVDFTSNDRLALNGQRLIRSSGTWFAANSEYKTQHESFQRIKYTGSGFEIETPEGLIQYYGETPESRLQNSSGVTLTWYITREVDRFGNTIKYIYNKVISTNEILIDRIEYTKTNIFEVYNKIQFTYENARTDYLMEYVAGIKINADYILKKIQVYTGSNKVKELIFNYFKDNDFDSYLSSIDQFGESGLQSNSTQFNWVNRPSLPGINDSYSLYEDNLDVSTYTQHQIDNRINGLGNKYIQLVLDAEGDGVSDILSVPSGASPPSNLILRYNKLNSAFSQTMPTGYKGAIAIDMDGDGKEEVLFHKGSMMEYENGFTINSHLSYSGVQEINGAPQFHIMKFSNNMLIPVSTGNNYGITGLLNLEYKIYHGDFDGNGTTDLLFVNHGTSTMAYMLFLSEVVSPNIAFVKRAEGTFSLSGGTFHNADFNGDGKQDLIYTNSTGIYVNYLSKVTGSSNYVFGNWTLIKAGGVVSSIGDLNGDGRVDIFDVTNRKIYFSKGIVNQAIEEQTYTDASGKFIGADCNGDGLNEIMSFSYSQTPESSLDYTNYYISGGSSTYSTAIYCIQKLHSRLFGDFNGDGIVEKLFYYAYVDVSPQYPFEHIILEMNISSLPNERQEMLVGSVLDGLNNKISIDYDYTSSAGTSYSMNEIPDLTIPVRVVNPRWIVVKNVKSDNGRDGLITFNYQYQNARIHLDGKGFMGFGITSSTNMNLGIKVLNNLGYNTTVFDAFPISSVQSTTNNPTTDISSKEYVFTYYSYGTNGQKHYIIYPSTLTSYDYLQKFRYNTTYTFNTTYGKNTKVVHQSYLTSPSLTLKQTIINDYTYESYLGGKFYRLTTSASTTTRPSQIAAKTKKSLHYLNTSCNRILEEIIYYYNPVTGAEDTDKDTISYTYTALGNLNSVSSQLGNIKRTVSYEYESKERFQKTTTDPLGFKITTLYNDQGFLLSVTDANNLTVINTYDGLGRLLTVNNPDASDQVNQTGWVEPGDNSAPQFAVYYHKVMITGKPYVKTYYDILGRALRTVTVAQNNKLIFTDVVYNEKGQQVQASMPYFQGETIRWNYTTYYNDGRVLSTYMDNKIKNTTFTYSNNKVTQTMNNTEQVYSKTFDPTGAVTEATDPGGTIKYEYYSSGNLKSSIAPSCTTTVEYDKYNRQKKITDPNAGVVEFEHNAYGEIMYQKDARGNWFRYTKTDKAGRPLIKTSSDGSTVNYTYDTDFKGALSKVDHSNGTSSEYRHDPLGLVNLQKEIIAGTLYEISMDYDPYSNIRKIGYPSFNVTYTYTSSGYLSNIKYDNNTVALWSAGDVNALGEWMNFTLGNGINRSFTYNEYGMSDEIKTGSIQSLKYDFDKETGNLRNRKDVLKSLTENFTYNKLDQLTSWKVGSTTYNVSYKADGTSRIDTKADAGMYDYGATPDIHQVTGINNNPGTLNSSSAVITYNSFNKVATINESGSCRQEFTYAADQQRRISKLYNSSNTLVRETVYVPGGYEIEKRGGNTRQLYYIPVGDCYALYTKYENASFDSLYFILTDHLGSAHIITSSSGAKLKELSFDPWGRRRNPADWTYDNVPAAKITNRGFTMHEHMDQFNLINMNGRVYDPVLGQFLSPDPFVSDPASTISYNRYAYCSYNPLKYVDPSGYLQEKPLFDYPGTEYINIQIGPERNRGWYGYGSFGGGIGGPGYVEAMQNGYTGRYIDYSLMYLDFVQYAASIGQPYRKIEKTYTSLSGFTTIKYRDAEHIIHVVAKRVYTTITITYYPPQGGGGPLGQGGDIPGGRTGLDNAQIGLGAYGIAHETKEALLDLAAKADPKINNMKYVKVFKGIGKFTGITSAGFSWAEYYNNPTTGNLIQALSNTGLVFIRINPIVGIGVGILDLTGASDYIYDQAGNLIDKL